MIFLLLFSIVFIAVVLYAVLAKKYQVTRFQNIFKKINCSGKSDLAPLSEKEKRLFLRRVFRPSLVVSNWDVIIIGSGLCGLTAAKFLALAGRKVLVLEQHDRAGGACHTFELETYEFDVGLHYVSQMRPGTDTFNICAAASDSRVQWKEIEDPIDRVIIGEKIYERKKGDHESFHRQLLEMFPAEKESIDAYFKYMHVCTKEVQWFFKAKFAPLYFIRFLFKTGLFQLLSSVFKCMERTLLDVMEEYKLSPELQTVMSYYFVNYGAPPSKASFLLHSLFFLEDEYYPIGGATSITASIIKSIETLGGKVLVRANVNRISFENGRVNGVMVDYGGEESFIAAPMVLSTASLTHVFNELVPKEIGDKSAISEAVDKLNQLDVVRVAAFQAYIGLSGAQEELKLPSTNYFWFKNSNVNELDKYLSLSVEEAIDYGCPPIVYICFPSAKDPTWNKRHPAEIIFNGFNLLKHVIEVSTCQLISFVNPSWFEDFKDKTCKKSQKRIRKESYLRLKQMIGETLIECLMRAFPDISSKIAYVEYSTPLSQQFYMQNSHGELYSLSQRVERFLPNIWSELRCKTDIPGLYLSGQDVLFCGVSSAFMNGLLTASVILETDLLKCLNDTVKKQTIAARIKTE